MWADDSEAIASELSRARRTDEKSLIASCLGQPAAKVTTHRTGADDILILQSTHKGRIKIVGQSSGSTHRLLVYHQPRRNI